VRYIEKTETPEFFTEVVKDFDSQKIWEDLPGGTRKSLKKHIRKREQMGLCAYCEIKVEPKTSHIEHIKPRSKYPEGCFDYGNMIVSCNGKECRNPTDTDAYDGDIHSCGHKRKDEFDETLFLSPIVEKNISDFFDFDKETGSISDASSKDEEDRKRARYTVDLLNLDNNRLNQYRRNARRALETELRKIMEKQGAKVARQKLMEQLALENNPLTPFVTFLRFCFRNTINKAEQEKTLLQAD